MRLEKTNWFCSLEPTQGYSEVRIPETTWEQVKAAGITGVSVLAIYAPPSGASRLAARTGSGLFISEDSGRTWQPALVPDGYYIYDVALPVEHDICNSGCNFARRFAVY